MSPLGSILLGLGLTSILSTPALAGQTLKAIFASDDFTTTSGEGDEINHNRGGFALTNSDGVELYWNRLPGNDVACYRPNGGRSFTLTSDCLSAPREFHCLVGGINDPYTCDVSINGDYILGEDAVLGEGEGDDSHCYVSFDLSEDEFCDENAEWEVI